MAIDFSHRCVGNSANFYGQLRYNSAVAIDSVRRVPDTLNFVAQANVSPGTTVTSNQVTVSALDVAAAVSIVGGEVSINDGTFTGSPGSVNNGDQLQVRLTAPAAGNRRGVATLNVGGYEAQFVVTTPVGNQPQPFGDPLIVVTGLPQYDGTGTQVINSPANSKAISIDKGASNASGKGFHLTVVNQSTGGTDLALDLYTGSASVAPGTYTYSAGAAYGAPYFSTYGSNMPQCSDIRQSTVLVYEVANDANGVPTQLAMDYVIDCGVAASGYSRILGYVRFNSTVAIDYAIRQPIAFYFPGVKNADPNTVYISATGGAQGITEPVAISIVGGEYSVGAAAFTSASGTISPGHTVRVRLTSAPTANTLRTATVTMGGADYVFRVGTAPGAEPQSSGQNMFVSIKIPRDPLGSPASEVYSAATLYKIAASVYYSYSNTNQITAEPFDRISPYYYSAPAYFVLSGASQGALQPGTYEHSG
ncbi:MAG: hypothetical protein JNJ55_04935, partial [Betaproteobacteria bacterium]|nr:hypothetical protein [Betaproteobacteria bacterium]